MQGEEFQAEFEASWIKNHLVPTITERLDPLFSWTEPLLPRRFERLDEPAQKRFLEIREKHEAFGTILFMLFSSYARMITKREFPRLPLRGYLEQGMRGAERLIPDAALTHGAAAIDEFRTVLGPSTE